jgi:hypothetical protein
VTLVNCDKVYEFAVFLNVYVRLLNFSLQIEDLFLLAIFGFEERFKRGLAQRHFLQLLLIISLLAFSFDLLFHDFLSATHCVDHTLNIKHLTLDPESSLLEGIFVGLNLFTYLFFEITSFRVSKYTFFHTILTEILDC